MKKLKVKVNIKEVSAGMNFIDFLNIKDEIDTFSASFNQDKFLYNYEEKIYNSFNESKTKLFYFILKLSIKYLTNQQKKIFINIWLHNCGDKKIKKDKDYYLNWILYKMALRNIKKIILETPYFKYLERYLNENR
jgi:hypothetical protein